MNYAQNEKIAQVKETILLVGIDVKQQDTIGLILKISCE